MAMRSECYESKDGLIKLNVTIDASNSIWLTQLQIANLFGKTKQNICIHIRSLSLGKSFQTNNVKQFRKVSADNKRYLTNHYSLEVISNIAFRTGLFERYVEFYDWCKRIIRLPNNIYIQKRKEYYFKDLLLSSLKDICRVYSQYSLGKYFLDYFIPEYNLVIEYDENHHKIQHNKYIDIARETKITNLLPKATIIRVTENMEIEGLNNILKHIIKG